MNPDQIKQQLLASVRPGTAESVISDVGEAAVFRSDSPLYATATAFLKGRILGVHLDGLIAREKKDQAIALLKSAASRLERASSWSRHHIPAPPSAPSAPAQRRRPR
jgi:hypothetical protein